MVSQDLMIKINAMLLAIYFVQFVLSCNSRGFFVPQARADLAQIFALDTLRHHVVTLFSGQKQVTGCLEYVVVHRVF